MIVCAASNNAGKLKELRRILEQMGHEVKSLRDLCIDLDPEETGTTFAENARIKAEAFCKASGLPTVADDSGLCVDALHGAPGVYSARYAGHHGDDAANNAKLLHEMADVPAGQRAAKFVSAICFMLPDGRALEVAGECPGSISFAETGSNGFGYDPLFVPAPKNQNFTRSHFSMQGKTTAQLRGSWHKFSKYRPLIRELVTRDLKVKYRRSFLGYVWSILNPLLMMLLQTLVFSYMFRFQIENFPLYLICGNTLFNFFNESTNMGMGSVLGNSSLIKKVYVPKFIFPISRVVSSFVNLLFSLAAIILVMLITRSPFHLTILLVWAPLVLLFLFTCGMALLLSALAVYFRDLQYLYGIVTMAWMYATPLFYPISALPPFMEAIVKLNPLYHYINCMRCLVMYGTVPGPNTWFACIVCAVGVMVVGLAAFRKLQRNFILYL